MGAASAAANWPDRYKAGPDDIVVDRRELDRRELAELCKRHETVGVKPAPPALQLENCSRSSGPDRKLESGTRSWPIEMQVRKLAPSVVAQTATGLSDLLMRLAHDNVVAKL
jgi:hypothetical protein